MSHRASHLAWVFFLVSLGKCGIRNQALYVQLVTNNTKSLTFFASFTIHCNFVSYKESHLVLMWMS